MLVEADGPLTAAEVGDRVSGSLAYSTVVTTLGRLYAKGVLTRSRQGRAHAYEPAASEAAMAAARMRDALDGQFDHQEVLARFVSDLTGDEEAVLRQLLADHPTPDTEAGEH